jgi:hypothetical protein
MIESSWLQKHPSPVASGGEFHWYPEAGDRELRASSVERMRGLEPPAVLWQLEPGRVAWGQLFSAIAPLDGRHYTGLVLSVVTEAAAPAELLAMLVPPAAAPWGEPGELRDHGGDAVAVARALLSGGAAVADPTPQWVAALECVMPATAAVRCGVWTAGIHGARDRVAELAVAAATEPGSRAARAWILLCELAVARGESVDEVAAREPCSVLTPAERVHGTGVVGALHAWGRGRFDPEVTRLADLVALRALAELAADRDPGAAIAEVRWTALLPAARRTALLAAVARRTGSLRELVEAHHG